MAATGIAFAAVLAVTACRPITPPAGGVSGPAPASGSIEVKPEDTGNAFRREDWPHWATGIGGCDARETALKAQGRGVRTDPKTCRVLSGQWTDPYDGATITDPASIDLDHLVPLAEAARSGVRALKWTRADRERYANDQALLVATSARNNRQKGDQDPAHWLPKLDRCGYVKRWQETKTRYHLTEDQVEASAIAAVLQRC